MSHLDAHVSVRCPLAQGAKRLGGLFAKNGNADGDTALLDLRVDVAVPGLPSALHLEREVVATMQFRQPPGDMTPHFDVQWAPRTPGPFPLFAGRLSIEAADDYDSFTLALRGDYDPPLGLVGKGFDAAVGNTIANATALDLLERIKSRIEADFRADEARKPGAHLTHPA
jgi:hypothetical protein